MSDLNQRPKLTSIEYLQARLPAGQAVIFCRMCGAKHGLWSFLGAGGPDLSAARRPRLPASSSANGAAVLPMGLEFMVAFGIAAGSMPSSHNVCQ